MVIGSKGDLVGWRWPVARCELARGRSVGWEVRVRWSDMGKGIRCAPLLRQCSAAGRCGTVGQDLGMGWTSFRGVVRAVWTDRTGGTFLFPVSRIWVYHERLGLAPQNRSRTDTTQIQPPSLADSPLPRSRSPPAVFTSPPPSSPPSLTSRRPRTHGSSTSRQGPACTSRSRTARERSGTFRTSMSRKGIQAVWVGLRRR
jgi:hypothetical protein